VCRSPSQIVRRPNDDELRNRISCVQEVDDCVWEVFVVRIGAGGDVDVCVLWRLVDGEVKRSPGFLHTPVP